MADQGKLGLGKVIPPDQVMERDAIHVAIAPVVVGSMNGLYPCAWVRFLKKGDHTTVAQCDEDKAIGILDPFLPEGTYLSPGTKVWLYLKPQTITSLRHDWTHPAFEEQPDPPVKVGEGQFSRWWLEEQAKKAERTYEEFMEGLAQQSVGLRFDTPDEFYDKVYLQELWVHYEIVTGETVRNYEENPFYCSC